MLVKSCYTRLNLNLKLHVDFTERKVWPHKDTEWQFA